jgi:D-alanyl-D-alanine carboxypeptidase
MPLPPERFSPIGRGKKLRKMRILFTLFVLLPCCLSAQFDELSATLKAHIDPSGKHPVHGIQFYYEPVEKGTTFHAYMGHVNKKGEPVSQDTPFKIASITKTFVATLILQLAEESKLGLDDRIIDYLAALDFLNFEQLHLFNKQSCGKNITIRQCLSHQSGLADLFNDAGSRFFLNVLLNRRKSYTPKAIVEKYYRYRLNKKAPFPPGEGFHYSDMNYVLLGLLIEEIENQPLAAVIRERITGPLNMANTYLEYYESPSDYLPQLEPFLNRTNMARINTSFDWAGGGLVSTTTDLATFYTALFEGQLINQASLQQMTDVQYAGEHENRYGLGLYESNYQGAIYFGHYGFYGSYAGYCPENQTVLVYNIGQANPDFYVAGLVEQLLTLAAANP